MYSTFSAYVDTGPKASSRGKSSSTTPRPKRNQVSRACDWCRSNRIKCDDKQPCQNCVNRDGFCNHTRAPDASSLPAANREIERLRNKVQDLEEQLRRVKRDAKVTPQPQEQHQNQNRNQTGIATPISSVSANETASYVETLANARESWQGVQRKDARDNEFFYGPMSSAYFVDRVRRYLSEALNMPWEDTKLETFMTHLGCASSFYSPSLTESSSLHPERLLDVTENPMNLTRAQEESFLNLFWQSFHCMYPILSEPDFREYYGSLWADTMLGGSTARRPSPLVDVLLAVCMQYGSTFLFSDGSGGNTSNLGYARTPGYEFYQRSQRTLQRYLETPSIMVLQSHIYCIIYLCNISHFNAAHMNLGMTLRIAHALRLHLQPLENISAQKQELHRRIWWTLFCLDSQLSMTLGRASFIHPSQVSCGLPGDDLGPIRSSGSMLLSSHEDISWLSFHIQCIKITAAVQSIHATFKQKCSELLRDGPQDIYETPCIIEALADCLAREMGSVHEWVRNVPQSLRLSRQGLGTGEPFSTNKAPLNLDLSSPLWLQRQRLLLELFYHHLQLSIFRPFLRFPPVGASQTPLADNYGISCVNHATVITSIIHQVLTTTDLLHGWPSILQTQWDAILCTLGFILGNPVCSPTPFARKSLQIAVQTLELVADYSPIAKSAAQVTRAMDQHADTLITNFRQSLVPREAQRSTYSPSLATQNPLPRGTQNPLENTTQAASLTTTGVLTLSTGNFEPVLATNGSMEAVGAQDGILATAWNELSSNLALNDPPSAAPSSIDMLNSSEMHWIHANGMSLDSWNELAVIP